MKKFILILIVSVSVMGCTAMHSGYMANSTALSSANFTYKSKNISGKASCTYILGIGGLNRDNLIRDAKKAMLEANPLMDNQAIANLTVSFKKSFYLGLIIYVDCVISGDIVEFK